MNTRTVVLALAVIFPIVVFADVVATSTATSTPASIAQAADISTTTPSVTPSVPAVATSTVSSTTTVSAVVAQSVVATSSPVIASISASGAIGIRSIVALEESYRRQNNKYLQVLKGNALPSYENGTVQDHLGQSIADNVRVDTYDAPSGKGYQVVYEENGILYSVGYGPEAQGRTYSYVLANDSIATSSKP